MNEDAQNEDAQNEDAQNEDAQNEDAQNEDAQNEDAQNEDARGRTHRTETYAADRAIVAVALPHAVQARLLALIADREERSAAWRETKEVIGWDTPMDPQQRVARLILLVTLMTIHSARPSLAEEAFDEFLRALTGGEPEPGRTAGARAFNRAEGWLVHLTRAGIIAGSPRRARAD